MDRFNLALCKEIPKDFLVGKDSFIDEVTIHSKLITSKATLFVCLEKDEKKACVYLEEAFHQGAAFALIHHEIRPKERCPHLIPVNDPLFAMQELAKAYRQSLQINLISIMGSYGKTLLKDLLYYLVSDDKICMASPDSFNSQIGVPLSIFELSSQHEYAFIEAAASEANEITRLRDILRPSAMIITPLSTEHPYIFRNDGALKKEYLSFGNSLKTSAWLLAESSLTQEHMRCLPWDTSTNSLPYLKENSAEKDTNYQIISPKTQESIPLQIEVTHPNQIQLISIAIKAYYLLGFSLRKLADLLSEYTFEERQREIWKTPTGTTFQNDPYVSHPLTLLKSLNQFQKLRSLGNKWMIFGGFKDLGFHSDLYYITAARLINQAGVHKVILYDQRPPQVFYDHLSKNIECNFFKTLNNSLKYLKEDLQFEDAVLISGARKINRQEISHQLSLSLSPNQLTVDLTAIKQNIELLKSKLGYDKRLMPVIKSHAYGTDSVIVALFLETCGIDIFGVAYVSEALLLRKFGVKADIFVLHALPEELDDVVKWDLEVAINDEKTLCLLDEAAKKRNKISHVHLHVDTGMTRLGCLPSDALRLARKIYFSQNIELSGLMTHFAQSEDPSGDGFTLEQAQTLATLHQSLKNINLNPRWIHAENSAAAIRFEFPSFNMVRIGLALFGLGQFDLRQHSLPLKPALSLLSQVSAVHHCKKGDTVSYGRNYKVESDNEIIAVIPIGYFDGIHRHYAENGRVMIRNKFAPVVGSICMDFMMVNVSKIPDVSLGDSVLIFGFDSEGHEISPETFARDGQTITHELITCLGPRIQRVFISDEHAHPISQHEEKPLWTAKSTSIS